MIILSLNRDDKEKTLTAEVYGLTDEHCVPNIYKKCKLFGTKLHDDSSYWGELIEEQGITYRTYSISENQIDTYFLDIVNLINYCRTQIHPDINLSMSLYVNGNDVNSIRFITSLFVL